MDPFEILAPNSLGNMLTNFGLEEFQNKGFGVNQITPTNPQASVQKSRLNDTARMKDQLRIAKAREFGRTKETVGF